MKYPIAIALAIASSLTFAESGEYTLRVDDSCTVQRLRQGTWSEGADGLSFSSNQAAKFRIRKTGATSSTITITKPSSFSQAPTGMTGTFSLGSISITGNNSNTSFSGSNGKTALFTSSGATEITIPITVVTNREITAGDYKAAFAVTCG